MVVGWTFTIWLMVCTVKTVLTVTTSPTKNLTYLSDTLHDESYCHHCTDQYYSIPEYFESPCFKKNRGLKNSVNKNGTVFKPWCSAASGIGFIKNCTIPTFDNGRLNCLSNLVYEQCEVKCFAGYTAVSRHLKCQEDGSFDGIPHCQIDECDALPVVNHDEKLTCDEKNPRKVGKSCNISCPGGEAIRQVTCEQTGNWSIKSDCPSTGYNFTDFIAVTITGAVLLVIVIAIVIGCLWKRRINLKKVPDEASTLSLSSVKSTSDKSTSTMSMEDEETGYPELTSSQRDTYELEKELRPVQHQLKPQYNELPPSYKTLEREDNWKSGFNVPRKLNYAPVPTTDPDVTSPKFIHGCSSAGKYSEGNPGSSQGEQSIRRDQVDYSKADRCKCSLEDLLENKNLYEALKHKLDVRNDLNDEQSIKGFALAMNMMDIHDGIRNPQDEINWTASRFQTGLNETPFTSLMEIMIQKGKKVGHLVMYFEQPDRKRQDVLSLLFKVHKNCDFCNTVGTNDKTYNNKLC